MEKYCAIYARQSVDKKDSISIEGQIDLCRAEVQGDYKVFSDKGFSGKNINRPEFAKLMDEVKRGCISKLICYRLDRISRSIMDFGSIWDTLSKHNVEFVSINEKFDTSTPVGRAMLYIIMVFAQLERETIAERIKDNYYQRVKKGAWPGGPAPYGFRIAKERINGQCTLEPTENIDVLRHIFELYAEPGMSLHRVAKRLTEDGIPCVQRKAWDSISVGRVLRNPAAVKADIDVYIYYKSKGLIIYNQPEEFTGKNSGIIIGKRLANERKYTDMSQHLFALTACQGTIDAPLFLTCQYKMDQNKQIKNTGKGKYTWLSGLLHCSECGYSLRVQKDTSSGKLRLICSGRTNYSVCSCKHTETVAAAEAFTEHSIDDMIEVSRSDQTDKSKDDHNDMKLALYKIEEKIDNLISAIADGNAITAKYINAEIQKLDTEKNSILQNIAEATVHKKDQFFGVKFSSLSFEKKKYLASTLIKRVVCSPKTFEIEWK